MTQSVPSFRQEDHARYRVQSAATDWPPLQPIDEIEATRPAKFPFHGLGPVMGAAAAAIADHVQAPDSLAGGAVLATGALAAQSHANVALPHGQSVVCSVFVLTSALSGARKSEVDRIATYPVAEVRKADARVRERQRELSDEEDLPKPTSVTVSCGTNEAFHDILRNQPHLGLFSPEGGEILAGHSMRGDQRAAGVAWYLKAWGGETLDSNTRGRGLSTLLGRRFTASIMVQPVLLRTLMGDPLAQGQGLIARMLTAEPASLAGCRLYKESGNPMVQPDIARFHRAVRQLLEQPPRLVDGGAPNELEPRHLELTPEARALWIEFYNAVEVRQGPGQDLSEVQPWASKAAEQAARIAGVATMIENPGATSVDAKAMDGAILLIGFYLSEHVRLMGQSRQLRHLGQLHALLKFMRLNGPRLPHATLLQKTPREVRDLKADAINGLLQELVARGYVRRDGLDWEIRND